MTLQIDDPLNIETRATDEGKIVGYGAVYDSPSCDFGGWDEIVKPGAFDATLAEKPDVLCRAEHEDGLMILGRTTAVPPTLRLWSDSHGLGYVCVPPNTPQAQGIVELIRRQDIRQSSFAFSLRGDNPERWDFSKPIARRELLSLNLYDVAPVGSPAYPATSVSVRSPGGRELDARKGDHARFELAKLIANAKRDCGEPDNATVTAAELRRGPELLREIYERGMQRAGGESYHESVKRRIAEMRRESEPSVASVLRAEIGAMEDQIAAMLKNRDDYLASTGQTGRAEAEQLIRRALAASTNSDTRKAMDLLDDARLCGTPEQVRSISRIQWMETYGHHDAAYGALAALAGEL